MLVSQMQPMVLGYECDQPSVHVEDIDAQVVGVLSHLKPLRNWRKGNASYPFLVPVGSGQIRE